MMNVINDDIYGGYFEKEASVNAHMWKAQSIIAYESYEYPKDF